MSPAQDAAVPIWNALPLNEGRQRSKGLAPGRPAHGMGPGCRKAGCLSPFSVGQPTPNRAGARVGECKRTIDDVVYIDY